MNGTRTESHDGDPRAQKARDTRMCPFCYSADTMEPFRRSPHVTFWSRLFPRLRWRYCRSCTHHFLTFTRRETRRTRSGT